jgi:hypothetical protein
VTARATSFTAVATKAASMALTEKVISNTSMPISTKSTAFRMSSTISQNTQRIGRALHADARDDAQAGEGRRPRAA